MSHTPKLDTIFVNGRAYFGGSEPTRKCAVGVANGTIAAIGTDAELLDQATASTTIVDLAGGLLSPGFRDSHVHALFGGIGLRQCSMYDVETAEDCFDILRAYADAHPDSEWLVGGGWNMDSFPNGIPTAAMADEVVADRPTYMIERGAHSAWVNSEALRRAGITSDTPDPADGVIGRYPDGSPNGMLFEGAASLVADLLPELSPADYEAGLLAAQDYLFSLGVTAWQDALIGAYSGFADNWGTYDAADRAGVLKADVVGALWWDRNLGLEQIPDLVRRRVEAHGDRFRPTTVKMMVDGVVEAKTASMVHPYLDLHGHPTDNHGLTFIEKETLVEGAVQLDALGFQLHFHALGDQAARDALDAIEEARRRNGTSAGRHHIAHLQVVQPDDIVRFAELDATANIQALWACASPERDELLVPFLGPDRVDLQWGYGSLDRAGTHLAVGSDWPVSSPDPILGMHVTVNRQPPVELLFGHPQVPAFLPEQGLELDRVWNAYTQGSAFTSHADHRSGSIQVGMDADLVALSRDPFLHPVDEISSATVQRTFVRGEQVYAAH
ncbi:amidohydrolase [Leifsonia sp. YAF41]|uniref:amidohydrolase n=1 Tax=Leifsonia sp. YAF41 TaxID=3233086 RepID=UPI003F95DB2D